MLVHPLLVVIIVAAVAAVFCWIASLVTEDTSWVDRLWSIVPVIYVWIFAIAGLTDGADATRLVVMALLVTACRRSACGTRCSRCFSSRSSWARPSPTSSSGISTSARPAGGVINPGIIGAVLLTLLFLGSTVFTESISAAKYPAYAEYRRTTSMLVPLPRRRVS